MSHKNLHPGDRVTLSMPKTILTRHAEVWSRRVEDAHLGVVVTLLPDGDVRVWDTVEDDWWVSDAKHLRRLP